MGSAGLPLLDQLSEAEECIVCSAEQRESEQQQHSGRQAKKTAGVSRAAASNSSSSSSTWRRGMVRERFGPVRLQREVEAQDRNLPPLPDGE